MFSINYTKAPMNQSGLFYILDEKKKSFDIVLLICAETDQEKRWDGRAVFLFAYFNLDRRNDHVIFRLTMRGGGL